MLPLIRAAAVLLALLVAAAPARAAYPELGESYSVHDHVTKGKNWHVAVEISRRTRLMARTIVVYVQECGLTPSVNNAEIDRNGRIAIADVAFDLPGETGQGRWSLTARFKSAHELTGEYHITTPSCDTGPRTFTARAGGHGHGDGHGAHSDHHSGTRPGQYPPLSAATARQRAQARRLWRGTLAAAAFLYPTYIAARAAGQRRSPLNWKRPVLFHLRHDGYAADDAILDPFRPESLVYWWPRRGSPILLGFMYRAPLRRTPAFAGKLLAWHSHIRRGGRGDNKMTHVWLTRDLRSALANCLPVEQLQKSVPRFRYSPPSHGAGHESRRCRG